MDGGGETGLYDNFPALVFHASIYEPLIPYNLLITSLNMPCHLQGFMLAQFPGHYHERETY